MAKKTAAQRMARLESIVIASGFLLRKLQASYGSDFGVGMEEQVRDCIRDCLQVERAAIQRDESARAALAKAGAA